MDVEGSSRLERRKESCFRTDRLDSALVGHQPSPSVELGRAVRVRRFLPGALSFGNELAVPVAHGRLLLPHGAGLEIVGRTARFPRTIASPERIGSDQQPDPPAHRITLRTGRHGNLLPEARAMVGFVFRPLIRAVLVGLIAGLALAGGAADDSLETTTT